MMKKTICLLLLSSLATMGCVATREIPMSHSSWRDMVSLGYIDSLPVLPIDLGHIQHIDVPAPSVVDKEGKLRDYQSFREEYIQDYEVVQLDPLPGLNGFSIHNIEADGDRLFVTFRDDGSEHDPMIYPDVFAIYTRKGKFVALLGEAIPANHYTGEVSRKETNDAEYGYIVTRMYLNRQAKEVFFTNGLKNVCFDYNGRYLRTDVSRCAFAESMTRGKRIGLMVGLMNAFNISGVVCDEKGIPTAVTMKGREQNQPYEMQNYQVDDDLMMGLHQSDTIWHLLPDKTIARYVYRGHANAFEQVGLGYEERNAGWRNRPEKYRIFATDKHVLTEFAVSYYDKEGQYQRYVKFYNFHDAKSGKSLTWQGIGKAEPYISHIASNPIGMMPDGSLVRVESAYTLKKALAHQLENPDSLVLPPLPSWAVSFLKEKNLDPAKVDLKRFYVDNAGQPGIPKLPLAAHIDARLEKHIRNLKVDGGPVLFFVKLRRPSEP